MNQPDAATIATIALPDAIKTLWRVVAIVLASMVVIAGVVIAVLAAAPWVAAAAFVVAMIFLAVRWWTIELGFDRWRWGVDERWVERRSGVVIRTTQIVPRSRVQTLTTRTGPIDRWLGLSSIVIHTAGTHTPNLTIPHLSHDSAEHLRTELAG